MVTNIISSSHFERAFLTVSAFLPAVIEEQSDDEDQHRSSCSSDQSESIWSERPESFSSLSSDECNFDADDSSNDDSPTYSVGKFAKSDIREEIKEPPRYPTTSVSETNSISKQETPQNIHKYERAQRKFLSYATITALASQRRSITSSPWTCLEESHHPLCPGDCDIGIVIEAEDNNNVTNAHPAASIRSSLYSSSAPIETDNHLPQRQKHDHDYTWLASPPALIRQRIVTYSATISEQSISTTRTHRRNKDVLCAPATSAFRTGIHTTNINQLNSNCPSLPPLPSQTMQHRRKDASRLSKLLDRHPRGLASSLCFENAEEFEMYLRLERS